MNKRKLRFGVVGLGKMGLLHASILNVLPDIELVAFCEKSTLMRKLFKKVFSNSDINVVDDVKRFQGLNLDAIYVTTPISSHFSIIKQIYREHLASHVFTEKTLTLDYGQSRELSDVAKDSGGVNMVGYMKRFSMVFGKAREILCNREIGELQGFKAYAYSSDFIELTQESKSLESRGGALCDIGCHVIDLALWIFGRLEVNDVLSFVKNGTRVESSVSFKAVNSDGLSGLFNISQSLPGYRMPEFGLSIEGSNGRIDVSDDRLCLSLKDGNQRKWHRHDVNDGVYFSIGEPEYYRADSEFVKCILNYRGCESSFENATVVDYIIDQVRNRSRMQ